MFRAQVGQAEAEELAMGLLTLGAVGVVAGVIPASAQGA